MSSTFPDFYKGGTLFMTLVVKDIDGDTIDITGDSLSFMLKRNEDDSDSSSVINKDATITVPTRGRATLTLTNTNTDQTIGNYYYEFMLTRSTGEEYTLESGAVYIKERVND